ncbi:MAG: alpha/beta hydrolase family protein [Steroidobacteraceae bacterium]
MRHGLGPILVLGLAMATGTAARDAPSRPGVDAPELAHLGRFDVGVRTLALVDSAQVDVLAFDPAAGVAPKRDRALTVDLWYPAGVAAGATPETYSGSFPAEPPALPMRFTIRGIAVRDARPAEGRFPLVVVSHGYSNESVAMSWLTENLASKGYVVAAIRHADPPITDRSKFPELLLRRPLDIAFVTRALQRSLADGGSVDPSRVALIGYSMGGYGVLTAAGGELDPESPLARMIPGSFLAPYARGGASRDALHVAGMKAVVAISPVGGSLRAWGSEGLRAITAPLLLISGDRDWTVDYQTGARAFFDMATKCNRYLLTIKGAGHRIALGPAPVEMRHRLWDLDWFEDPVWRQDRIVGINLHLITAFLDRYVKDDVSRAAYLDGLTPESVQGEWPASADRAYDAYSPGADGITVWKGFQRQHAEGLELLHETPDE